MNAGRVLREARRRAGLTQRQLAEQAGVKQSAIARIESGRVVPRVDTLDRLLAAAGEGLYAERRMGVGADRTQIRSLLRMDPSARIASAEQDLRWLPRTIAIRGARGVAEDPPRYEARTALATLVRHGVRFVLIGGLAARMHGSPLITRDIDICYARDRANLTRLAAALVELAATLRGAPEGLPFRLDAQTLWNGDHFTFSTVAGDLDCLGTPAGVAGFAELDRTAVDALVDEVPIRVASVSDLLRMKRAAGRTKDIPHIEWLAALQDEVDREVAERRDEGHGAGPRERTDD